MSATVVAAIDCQLNGRDFQITSAGQRLRFEAPDQQTGMQIIREFWRGSFSGNSISILRAICCETTLDIEIWAAEKRLCAVGPDSGVWWLAIVGQPHVYISPRVMVQALWRPFFRRS